MWIGTAMGLYLLNRDSGKYEYIKLEAGSTYINTLYQADNGLLYVGTNGAGVFIYDAQNKKFEHYIAKNSALVSNSIFTILPEVDGRIMMSTENGVTSFHTKEKYSITGPKEKDYCLPISMLHPEYYVKIRTLYLVVRTELSNFPKM